MQNIVLDTNCLIMSLSPNKPYYRIWQDFLLGRFNLCITNDIFEEYLEVIGRNLSQKYAEYIATILLNSENVLFFDPHFSFYAIDADPDDNKFVDCAILSNARFIVTEDHHFDVLKTVTYPRVDVIGIDEFLKELG